MGCFFFRPPPPPFGGASVPPPRPPPLPAVSKTPAMRIVPSRKPNSNPVRFPATAAAGAPSRRRRSSLWPAVARPVSSSLLGFVPPPAAAGDTHPGSVASSLPVSALHSSNVTVRPSREISAPLSRRCLEQTGATEFARGVACVLPSTPPSPDASVGSLQLPRWAPERRSTRPVLLGNIESAAGQTSSRPSGPSWPGGAAGSLQSMTHPPRYCRSPFAPVPDAARSPRDRLRSSCAPAPIPSIRIGLWPSRFPSAPLLGLPPELKFREFAPSCHH